MSSTYRFALVASIANIAIIASGACTSSEQVSPDIAEHPTVSPRVLITRAPEAALALLPRQAPRTPVPDYERHGWRLSLISERADWEEFITKAGVRAAEFAVDFDREVLAIAAYNNIGGQLTFVGWEVAGGRGVLQYGPPGEFGPAWADGGWHLMVVAVPRAGLTWVDFVQSGELAATLTVVKR